MKKNLFFLLLSILVFGQKKLSKIDSIRTEKAAETFIHSFGENYQNFKIKKVSDYKATYESADFCKKTAGLLKINKAFYKADFDYNGFTDIMIIGTYYDNFYIIIAMSFGNNNFELKYLTTKYDETCLFPKIIDNNIIRYYYKWYPNRSSNTNPKLKNKDLIFKYDDFIEYNKDPKLYNIEKIEYQTTACYGSCPVFSITIDNNRHGIFNAKQSNQMTNDSAELLGVYKTDIDNKSYSEITDLLNYIDFPNLNNEYAVSWTDDQTSYLTITYNNGKVKTIRDYGLIGTHGLDKVYDLLFKLRFNQKWIADPPKNSTTDSIKKDLNIQRIIR
ncbi:MAG: DUF6438 domain-containing protein [Flavobacteriaceae bacterium]|jgi:hypothetical protein|nr:DUF6438 domain-containing protein [Flavobacteriaceae bacterium]